MTRRNPTRTQQERLLRANAYRCCVCKRGSVGFHFHHIDGDPTHTVDQNIAVLCVEDHDRHHRPSRYARRPRHLELDRAEILRRKESWEAFVHEAHSAHPQVVATLCAYGTVDLIHSLRLVMQWPDQRIEYQRSLHLLDGDLDRLTDEVFAELAAIGPNIKLATIGRPLPVEHCECCGSGLSRTLKPAVMARLTDSGWSSDSSCSIFINPDQASLAWVMSLREKVLCDASLHLCCGRVLHFASDGVDDRLPLKARPSVRTQATEIVNHMLRVWAPAQLLIGTGDHESPELIDNLELPAVWERRR